MSHQCIKKTLWNRLKIIGLFPCYVLTCACCSLYYYNHAKQFTSPLQHDFLRNRLLHYTAAIYLNAIGQNLEKIFKQILSPWTWLRLSIPLITKLCFKSSNDIVRKAAGGRLLWFTDYLSGGFGKCFLVINPKLYRKFLRAAYLVQFYLFSLLEIYCVCMRRRIWV